jgi:glycosyltransferase involved in cell wall biosynthesis
MRHVHVIDELKTGGAQTHLITMLRGALSVPGVEHHVVSLFGDGEMSDQIRKLGIPVRILDLRPHFRKSRFLSATREVQALLKSMKPDLVEAHLTWSRLIALFAAWRVGVPLRIGFEPGDVYLNSWKFRCANFVAQLFAHRVVVCSEALRNWVHRTHRISRSKLLVLHCCVDLTAFSPDGPKSGDVAFAPGTTVFCAVGTLGRGVNKRVDVCIQAVAEARSVGVDVKLVICGDGEQRHELEKLAASLGVGSDVLFLGTRSDVASILRACDAFCHAAPWEPFGIVALEAMAVGLPIVLPNSGGIREILESGKGGILYPALDHQSLGQAMVKLAQDRRLCKSMGEEGLRIAEERFSVQQYLSQLYGAYGIPIAPISAAMAGSRI